MSTETRDEPRVAEWARDWLSGDRFSCPRCGEEADVECTGKDDEGNSCVEEWGCACGANFKVEKIDHAVCLCPDDMTEPDGEWIRASDFALTTREAKLRDAVLACIHFNELGGVDDLDRSAKYFTLRAVLRDALDSLPSAS